MDKFKYTWVQRFCKVSLLLGLVFALCACGERDQTLGSSKDQKAHEGVVAQDMAQVSTGWQVGDVVSWQSQLKARAQYGLNEYTRTP